MMRAHCRDVLGTSILLRSSSPHIDRRVAALLRASGNELIADSCPQRCAAILGLGGVDLLLLDASDGADINTLAREAKARSVPVVLMCNELDAETLELFCDGTANHLLSGRHRADAAAVAVEKTLRRAPFGIDKYTPRFGIETYKFELRSGRGLDDAVESFLEFLEVVDCPEDTRERLCTAARELGENALYSAPRDAHGRRLYGPRDRSLGVEVQANERALLSYAFDGRRILLSVTDWFGTLKPARVRASLWRGRARTETSPLQRGGSGLRRVWDSASELVFNIAPDERTEIIAIHELDDAGDRSGIHLFFCGTEAEEEARPQSSIQVSDSMQFDIRAHLARVQPPPVVTLPRKRAVTKTIEASFEAPLIAADETPVGLDTMCGLLHGAGDVTRVLEVGLRFMTMCYAGAVVYEVEEGALRAVLGAGEIASWTELRATRLMLSDDCRLSDLARLGAPTRYRPSPHYRLDQHISQVTSGEASPLGYVLPLEIQEEVRYVLFGFTPKYGRHLADRVAESFQHEMVSNIERQLGGHPSRQARRSSTIERAAR